MSAIGGKRTLRYSAPVVGLTVMRRFAVLVLAAFCTASCSRDEPAKTERQNVAPQPSSDASFSVLGTSWTYPGGDGEMILETIDASGNYISTAGAKVADRGTVRMLNGQACFDSAQSNAPPNCWHVPKVAVGETKEYIDNHWQRLRVTRVAHVDR